MSKKILISLVAAAALAVIPAAAQASPHWFKNGSELKPINTELPIVAWGNLTLTASEIGTIECQNVIGGDIQNTGLKTEGVGIAEVEAFNAYDCTGVCPEVWKVTLESLPWDGELVVSEGLNKLKIGTTKPINVHVECPGLIIDEHFKGELSPTATTGTSATKPSFLELNAASGHLVGPVLGNGGAGGKAKVQGYNESEVLAAK